MAEIPATEIIAPIHSVNAEVLKRKVNKKWLGFGFLLIVFGVASLGISPVFGMSLIFFTFTIGFFSLLVIILFQRAKLLQEFMSQFAKANGYKFDANGMDVRSFGGALFEVGHSKKIYNLIEGEFEGHPLKIFHYRFMIGSGKQQTLSSNTVLELKLDTNLPNLFILSKYYWKQFTIRSSKDTLAFTSHPKKVQLGSGWDTSFSLYAPEDYEAEALQIFDHSVLVHLQNVLNDTGPFGMELVENVLFVYLRGEVSNTKRLNGMYETAKILVHNLGPLLKRMKPALNAQEEVFTRLNQVN